MNVENGPHNQFQITKKQTFKKRNSPRKVFFPSMEATEMISSQFHQFLTINQEDPNTGLTRMGSDSWSIVPIKVFEFVGNLLSFSIACIACHCPTWLHSTTYRCNGVGGEWLNIQKL